MTYLVSVHEGGGKTLHFINNSIRKINTLALVQNLLLLLPLGIKTHRLRSQALKGKRWDV
jgi:hypothetical protein